MRLAICPKPVRVRTETEHGLLKLSVANAGEPIPEAAIETFGFGLKNTYEETIALREWAVRNHARSLIVPTEIFSTRRVRWILRHELSATVARVEVPALNDPLYESADWWKDEKGIVAFQNEIIKYLYYRLKY